MLSWRLLLQTGEGKYADLIERTLLNAVLVSPREDGRAFYYANTLHQRALGAAPEEDELSERAEATLRAPWFEVSCCPTNVARTLASVSSYFATSTTDGVQIHQFGEATIRTSTGNGAGVEVLMRAAGYPFEGAIVLDVTSDDEVEISIRIPAWAGTDATVRFGDSDMAVSDGYARIRARFDGSQPIEVRLPMAPRFVYPDPSIDALRGTVAIERGPLVLCAESTDLPPEVALDAVRVSDSQPATATDRGAEAWFSISSRSLADWPYTPSPVTASDERRARLALHPYFAWANRGPSTMRVFIPVSPD